MTQTETRPQTQTGLKIGDAIGSLLRDGMPVRFKAYDGKASFDGSRVAFQVRWQGEPLADATVTIVGPGIDKKLEGTTDKEGTFFGACNYYAYIAAKN